MAKAHGGRTPEFGKALRAYRLSLGKRKSLAIVVDRLRELGYSTRKSTLSNYENGRPPDIGVLWGLAQIYDVNFVVLCEMVGGELAGHPPVKATDMPPTQEAQAIARAFDRGPDLLRAVLAGAVALTSAGMPDSGPMLHAGVADDAAAANESPGRKRRFQHPSAVDP